MPAGTPDTLTLLQAALVGLALLLTFVVTVVAAGFFARKLRIEDADYVRALWATLFANVASSVITGLLTAYLELPVAVVLLLAGIVVPMVIFRVVFETTFVLAGLLWLIVLIAEVAIGVAFVALALGVAEGLTPVEGLP